jgi:hypothetical protein
MLSHFARGLGLLALGLVVLVESAAGQDPKPTGSTDLSTLSLEVNALQALHALSLTDGQLKKVQGWAKETAEKTRKRDAGKASKEYREKLLDLRDALLQGTDTDRIDQLTEELDDLRETEKPTLDDTVNLTNNARKRATEMLRSLKPHQLVAFLDYLADDVADPLDRLLEAMAKTRALKGNEWKQKRDDLVDDIVRMAAGIDSKKADKLTEALTTLLNRAHGMSDAEFKSKRPELEKLARKVVGDLGPLEVLRNATEYALAELLSNPRLAAVLEARMKK